MTKRIQFSVLILLVVSLVFGCKHKAQMTVAEVIQVANQAAQDAGYHLTDYQDPKVHFEFTENNHTWSVLYEGKVEEGLAFPGNHFLVVVDDRTRKTRVSPGL